MIAVLQRVNYAKCKIDGKIHSEIQKGHLIYLGIAEDDNAEDVEWLSKKIINLRVFGDNEGKMNLSLTDISGEILVISQFTLHASTKKGNRPSFIAAAKPEIAIPIYESFIEYLKKDVKNVYSGVFGADMKIESENDGPVTIVIDTKNRK